MSSVLDVSVGHFSEDTMPNTKSEPAVIIVLTGPNGESETIEIPHAPPMPLAERLRSRLHCWHIAARNLVYWLKGGRW